MILLLPLLRRLSIRTRMTVGSLLVALGAVGVIAGLAGASSLVLQAVIALIVGAIFLGHGWMNARRAGPADGVRVAVGRR